MIVDHSGQSVINDGHFDPIGRHFNVASLELERHKWLLGWCHQNVAPMQVAVFKLQLLLSNAQC